MIKPYALIDTEESDNDSAYRILIDEDEYVEENKERSDRTLQLLSKTAADIKYSPTSVYKEHHSQSSLNGHSNTSIQLIRGNTYSKMNSNSSKMNSNTSKSSQKSLSNSFRVSNTSITAAPKVDRARQPGKKPKQKKSSYPVESGNISSSSNSSFVFYGSETDQLDRSSDTDSSSRHSFILDSKHSSASSQITSADDFSSSSKQKKRGTRGRNKPKSHSRHSSSERRASHSVSRRHSASPYYSPKRKPSQGLTQKQKEIIQSTIQEYCPPSLQDIVFQDIITQMKQLDDKGYSLPHGYSPKEHSLDENEIRLYEQQINREKNKEKKKIANLINFGAIGLSWFCQGMDVDWIKIKHLPAIVRESIRSGDFDDTLEGVGSYVRGTVIENPLLSAFLKFIEKVGEAHQKELDNELTQLEEKHNSQGQRQKASLSSLNKLRQSQQEELNKTKVNLDKLRQTENPAVNTTVRDLITTTTNVSARKNRFEKMPDLDISGNVSGIVSKLHEPLQQVRDLMVSALPQITEEDDDNALKPQSFL